jgi:hypothetical protein
MDLLRECLSTGQSLISAYTSTLPLQLWSRETNSLTLPSFILYSLYPKHDEFVKSMQIVMPAKAGIQNLLILLDSGSGPE